MSFEKGFFNVGYLDSLSYRDTFVHRLDPRVKLIATIIFIVCVVSLPKYEVSGLLPFFIFPIFMTTVGEIPVRYILKKLLIVSPFVVFIAVFNPFIDRKVLLSVGGLEITGGWVSLFSIIIKFVLTIGAALLLVATTSFIGICEALGRMKVPEVFVIQLLFLYRYLFVLLEEAFRMVRARDARSFGKRGYGFKPFIHLITVLLIRTLRRAERIYGAMVSRGFRGKIVLPRTHRITVTDTVFLCVSAILFLTFRSLNISTIIGDFISGWLS